LFGDFGDIVENVGTQVIWLWMAHCEIGSVNLWNLWGREPNW